MPCGLAVSPGPQPAAYQVSGRWAFASGIDHCAWWNGGCIVHKSGAPRPTDTSAPQTVLVFFPATDGERIDTWDTGGLRGTGSNPYTSRDQFVGIAPVSRTVPFDLFAPIIRVLGR